MAADPHGRDASDGYVGSDTTRGDRRRKAKAAIVELLRRAEIAGDIDLLAEEIIKVTLGVERTRLSMTSTCAGCGRIKVRIKDFQSDPSFRGCGYVQHGRGDYCSACYNRQRRGTDGPADPARAPRREPRSVAANAFPISSSLVAELRAADPEYQAVSR